jgi:hypothetical protein
MSRKQLLTPIRTTRIKKWSGMPIDQSVFLHTVSTS